MTSFSFSTNSLPRETIFDRVLTIASLIFPLKVGTCLIISSNPVPTMAPISFSKQRLVGITYLGELKISRRAGKGLAFLTSTAPFSVRARALMTFETDMMSSAAAGRLGIDADDELSRRGVDSVASPFTILKKAAAIPLS